VYGLRSTVKAILCGSETKKEMKTEIKTEMKTEIKTEMKTEIKTEMKTEKEMVCADMIYDGPRAVSILYV
jgi:hypothetical protein